MLQTEEVDDDYFTPIAGTSLANIFGNSAQSKDKTDNENLKYTPPKPQSLQKQPVQSKATECLFACAVTGHEWLNNVYTSRGKLGFAVIKIQKSGEQNIILYDANKITQSCTTISSKLELFLKSNNYISYYDNLQKYWSIYAADDDAKKIVGILTKFDVIIKESSENVGPPEPTKMEQNVGIRSEINLESDTDSSVNQKTKASILNRMANMGHSVFPTVMSANRTSDSSDTNEIDIHPKIVRHKPIKNNVKRNIIEGNVQSEHSTALCHKRNIPNLEQSIDNTIVKTSMNRLLIPTSSTSVITGSNSSDMGLFMSEQRISNTELRINMNRVTDKVDLILDKVNDLEQKRANLQTDILVKLLTEYESKIKVYEELLKTNNIDSPILLCNRENETELKNIIQNLEQENKVKNHEILALQNDIILLKKNYDKEKQSKTDSEDILLKKINDLESDLVVKDEAMMNLIKKCDSLTNNTNANNIDVGNKLKNIMNDTFQTISVNFENTEHYAGDTVKKIIAAVIKKITMDSLSEL